MSIPLKSKSSLQPPDLKAYQPISLTETISYSLGDVGFNLYWAPVTAFLMLYLTDVVGIGIKEVGTLYVVVRLVGAFAEPVFAALADRTHTSYGRYRVWFLWLAVPMAAAGVLTFSTSGAPEGGKLFYVYTSFILFNLIYTAIQVPYNALSGVITPNPREREILMSARFGAAFLTAVLVTWVTPKLVAVAGIADVGLGWQFAMTIYGVIAFAIFINLFLNTRERFSMVSAPHVNPLLDIRDLLRSRPWLVLFVLAFVVMMAFALHTGATPYFMKYYIGRPDMVTLFAMLFLVGLAAGSALTSTLTRLLSRSRLIALMLVLMALAGVGLYFTSPSQINLVFVLQLLSGLSLGTVSTITFVMYADVADYNAWKTGKRATAMTYSLIQFGKKIGSALAAAVVTWAFSSYTANTAPSPALLDNIRLMMGIAPAVLAVLGALIISVYDLSAERVSQLHNELFSDQPS